MTVHLIALLVFALLFLLTAARSVSMGLLAFAAAFLVGTTAVGLSTDEIVAGFPGGFFVILVGVTLLFGMAKANGTVDWMVQSGVRLTRGRVALIPWLMFFLSAILCGIGALGPAVVAILYPIGMAFVRTHRIRPLLIALMVSFGTTAGSFSPIGIFGIIVNQVMRDEDLPVHGGVLFLLTFLAGLVAGLVAFVLCGGRDLISRGIDHGEQPDATSSAAGTAPVGGVAPASSGPLTGTGGTTTLAPGGVGTNVAAPRLSTSLEQKLTLGALLVLSIGAIGFDLDVGLLAMTLAAALGLAFTSSIQEATKHISWPVVLLLGGVVTYVGVLEAAGTIEWLGITVEKVGAPLIAALVVCFIGAAVSAFASTTGMLGALIPLSVPLLLAGDVSAIGLAAALAISSSLVDASPFSTVGALAIANSPEEEQQQVYRSLLRAGLSLIVIAPVAAWLVLVVPFSLA